MALQGLGLALSALGAGLGQIPQSGADIALGMPEFESKVLGNIKEQNALKEFQTTAPLRELKQKSELETLAAQYPNIKEFAEIDAALKRMAPQVAQAGIDQKTAEAEAHRAAAAKAVREAKLTGVKSHLSDRGAFTMDQDPASPTFGKVLSSTPNPLGTSPSEDKAAFELGQARAQEAAVARYHELTAIAEQDAVARGQGLTAGDHIRLMSQAGLIQKPGDVSGLMSEERLAALNQYRTENLALRDEMRREREQTLKDKAEQIEKFKSGTLLNMAREDAKASNLNKLGVPEMAGITPAEREQTLDYLTNERAKKIAPLFGITWDREVPEPEHDAWKKSRAIKITPPSQPWSWPWSGGTKTPGADLSPQTYNEAAGKAYLNEIRLRLQSKDPDEVEVSEDSIRRGLKLTGMPQMIIDRAIRQLKQEFGTTTNANNPK